MDSYLHLFQRNELNESGDNRPRLSLTNIDLLGHGKNSQEGMKSQSSDTGTVIDKGCRIRHTSVQT